MRRQAQVGRGDGIALAAQVLAAHHVPQAKAHVAAAIGQARHAANRQRIGAFLAPGGDVGPAGFVQGGAGGIDRAELAAAFQVGLDDGRDLLRRLGFAAKRGDGDGQLGQAHAGHFDAELGERRQHRRRTHQANDLASPPLRRIIHVSWSLHHRFSSITVAAGPSESSARPAFGAHQPSLHAPQHPLAVGCFLGPAVFPVPEVEHLGGQKAVLAPQSVMMQPQHQVRVLMPPAAEGFVEAVDGLEVTIPDAEVAAADAFPGET